MYGWGYSFSMLQMWQMLQMFIQVHFGTFCDTFWHIQDSRRIRHLRRTSTQSHALTVIARNACPGTQASSPAKIRLRWLFFFLLSLIAVLISLVACKSPATLTNDTQHRTRDSNYHTTIHRIETHDTIILGYYPSAQPKLSNSKLSNCQIDYSPFCATHARRSATSRIRVSVSVTMPPSGPGSI